MTEYTVEIDLTLYTKPWMLICVMTECVMKRVPFVQISAP